MGTPRTSPLIDRPLEGVIARPGARDVSVADFLGAAAALADRIPDAPSAINLCGDRYHFLLAFCAVLMRGQSNLLPPSHLVAAQRQIAETYPDAIVIHDGAPLAEGLTAVDVRNQERAAPRGVVPQIRRDAVATVSFTSGTTGPASTVAKSWGMLFDSTAVNRSVMWPEDRATSVVATVPAQHMYGLETSILLPLRAPVRIHPGRPLYPADVAEALAEVPAPRILVSTPLHLRALVESGLEFPAVERVLCATAPIDAELATAVEATFGGVLLELYGCSEVGCLAHRHPAREHRWRLFNGFSLTPGDDDRWVVDAEHLDQPVTLGDHLAMDGPRHFLLQGRVADRVNIAGKRGSLEEITRLLRMAPGVSDGVVFEPQATGRVERLAALYSGEASPDSIRAHLREHLDPVFVPRPLLRVDELPRNETGKLPRQAVLEAFERAHAAS